MVVFSTSLPVVGEIEKFTVCIFIVLAVCWFEFVLEVVGGTVETIVEVEDVEVVKALKVAVIIPFPETEKIAFGSVGLATVRLPVYDQSLNVKLAGAIALAL